MRRVSTTSWGPRLTETGTLFRIWAPGEETLSLRHGGADHAMTALEEGWFELELEGAGAGAEYAFVLSDGQVVPDPASRAQAGDVHGPSVVTDPGAFTWSHWAGRPWAEAVILELHVGTYTPEGTFRAIIPHLAHLARTGITAIEIMPVAQFAGNRGWGYDGVLPYAPHPAYGMPEDMKALVDAAHGHGLMVLLDVVYNHFGPEGSYLSRYAPDFFDPDRQTPWGNAIAYARPPVRRFFIENALYWIEEFHLDGLRLDAIDHVRDPSDPEILVEIAQAVRARHPHAHLTTEDNRNITALHPRDEDGGVPLYTGEWNDDFHNVAHVIATGETEGYYADFAEGAWAKFARSLAQGFVWQGETPPTGEAPLGQPSDHLPPLAFVDFLQNHDQVGNRAYGERLIGLTDRAMLRALMSIHLLSPHVPLMFMGEEWGETRPFAFFTDFHGELADAVREGRRREFAGFASYSSPEARAMIPDPNAVGTYHASKLDWDRAASEEGQEWLDFTRGLLALRHAHVVPHLAGAQGGAGRVLLAEEGRIAVDWRLDGAVLALRANLSEAAADLPPAQGRPILGAEGRLAPRTVAVWLDHEG